MNRSYSNSIKYYLTSCCSLLRLSNNIFFNFLHNFSDELIEYSCKIINQIEKQFTIIIDDNGYNIIVKDDIKCQ